jgi:PAS domain S-box-containing protein
MRAFFSSLRFRLLLLILLAFVPAFGLTIYNGSGVHQLASAQARENVLRTTRLAAQNQEAQNEGARQLLEALSQLPQVRPENAADCNVLFASLLKLYPQYANLGMSDQNGNVYCSAIQSTPPANIADRSYFERALQGRSFAIGDYQVGRLTGVGSINFAYPVMDANNAVNGVVFAALDLKWLNQVVSRIGLPPGSTLLMLDSNGTILARYPDGDQWIGKQLPDAPIIQAVLKSRSEDTIETSGLDGVQRVYAYTPLNTQAAGNIYIVVGVPSQVAFAEVGRLQTINLIGLGLVVLLVGIATLLFSYRYIFRWMNRLVAATHQVAAGNLAMHSGISYQMGEFGQLAQAFDEMASSLDQRTSELRRVNRALRTISQFNQTMVRANSEEELLNEACRAIVEVGEYSVTWVGFAEKDEASTLRPVAQYGFEEGLLESVKISWADNELGQGPSSLAIRNGRTNLIKDLKTDPAVPPWRDYALARGITSAVAIPLLEDGQPFGVLDIFAADPAAFGEEEITLLEELAGDLAYGLQSLRTRANHEKAVKEITRLARFPTENPNPVLRVRRDGEILYANSASAPLLEQWGCTVGELLPERWCGLIEESFATGKKKEVEENGVDKIYSLVLAPLTESDYVNIYGSDITEKKRADQALQESSLRLHLAVEASNIGLWDWDLTNNQVYFSPQYKAQLGYRDDEFPDQLEEWENRLHPDERRRVIALVRKYIAAPKQDIEIEFRMQHKDGSYRWIIGRAEVLRDSDGKPVRMIGSNIDITERKKAEAALLESERRYRDMLEDIHLLAVILNLEGNITFCNDYLVELSGWPRDELIGQNWFERFIDPGHPVTLLFDETMGEGKFPIHYENEIITRDGQHRLIAWNNTALRDPDGTVTSVASIGEDITDRKRAEEEIRKLNEELEQRVTQRTAELEAKNRELETFTYSVSHDLKAPLRGIDGYSRLLLEDHTAQLDEEGQMFLSTIRRATDQMSQLINDLLDYSRLERRSMTMRPVDLNELVDDVLSELDAEIKEHGVALTTDIACQTVTAEPEGLMQALRNLIDNAVKFSSANPAPCIEIVGRETEAGCLISVKDNGIGFDMQYHDRIFEIFQRLSHSDEYPGTGIGLTIVRKIMQRMGGRVWAESTLGQGATFYLEIPRNNEK